MSKTEQLVGLTVLTVLYRQWCGYGVMTAPQNYPSTVSVALCHCSICQSRDSLVHHHSKLPSASISHCPRDDTTHPYLFWAIDGDNVLDMTVTDTCGLGHRMKGDFSLLHFILIISLVFFPIITIIHLSS